MRSRDTCAMGRGVWPPVCAPPAPPSWQPSVPQRAPPGTLPDPDISRLHRAHTDHSQQRTGTEKRWSQRIYIASDETPKQCRPYSHAPAYGKPCRERWSNTNPTTGRRRPEALPREIERPRRTSQQARARRLIFERSVGAHAGLRLRGGRPPRPTSSW